MSKGGPEPQEPPVLELPRWVPAAIGLVLVAMAGLAVYTGLRYRENMLANGIIKPRQSTPRQTAGGGPPGEPGPGASLVYPGEAGDNTPNANTPVAGRSRAEVSGGGTQGVTSTMRYWARRGMNVTAVPDDAMVYVNDVPIGPAKQLNTPDEIYDFPNPGSYTIRIGAPGYQEQQFVVTAADSAKQDVVRIEARLVKAP